MENDRVKDVAELPVPKLFEAGIFFSNSLLNVQDPAQIGKELLNLAKQSQISHDEIERALTEVAEDQEQAAEMTRLLLTLGSATGFESEVQEAVEGAGQKQGVELAELAFLSMIVLSALFLIFTRGRKEEVRKLKIRVDGDKVQIEDEQKVHYFSPGESVAAILKQAFAHILRNPGDSNEK